MSDTQPQSIGEGIGIYKTIGASVEAARVSNVIKTGVFTALGPTTLWTPAAGKKFRLMKYYIEVLGNAFAAAPPFILFYDGVTELTTYFEHRPFMAGHSLNIFGGFNTRVIDLGNGYLSSTINNSFRVLLGSVTTNGIRITAFGTEE